MPHLWKCKIITPHPPPVTYITLVQGVFRAELQGQGVVGGSGGDGNGNGKSDKAPQNGGGGGGEGTSKSDSAASSAGVEGLFMNVLRRLESIEVLGEETPTAVAGPAESVPASTPVPPGKAPDNRSNGNGHGKRDDNGQGALDSSQPPAAAGGVSAGGVGSSLAGVGAKLRSRLRKPGGFGLHGAPSGGGRGRTGGKEGDSGKAFVEGATKALAINRERVMGWMKDLRPKDWSPRAAERRGRDKSIFSSICQERKWGTPPPKKRNTLLGGVVREAFVGNVVW